MMQIMTMVAQDPGSRGGTRGDPRIDDGNVAINEIVDVVLPSSIALYRVSGLRNVNGYLAGASPDALQLIGHGCSGVLSLGYHWSRVYKNSLLGCQVLDSNPYSYALLWTSIKKRIPVLLVGCNVGSPEDSGNVANGQTLLKDLEQMWGTDVYAAESYVDPSQFKKGIYSGPLVTSAGERIYADQILGSHSPLARQDRSTPTMLHVQPQVTPKLSFVRLLGIPLMAPALMTNALTLSEENAAALNRLSYQLIVEPKLLALPEIELEVKFPGDPHQYYAYLCCTGKVLRVLRGDRFLSFEVASGVISNAQLYRSIIADALAAPAANPRSSHRKRSRRRR